MAAGGWEDPYGGRRDPESLILPLVSCRRTGFPSPQPRTGRGASSLGPKGGPLGSLSLGIAQRGEQGQVWMGHVWHADPTYSHRGWGRRRAATPEPWPSLHPATLTARWVPSLRREPSWGGQVGAQQHRNGRSPGGCLRPPHCRRDSIRAGRGTQASPSQAGCSLEPGPDAQHFLTHPFITQRMPAGAPLSLCRSLCLRLSISDVTLSARVKAP